MAEPSGRYGDRAPFKVIDETVSFVEKLLGKHEWGWQEREAIEKDLAFIAKKRNDKCLYLSVVGEFSSGKSTFINALLRENLLESDNIGGTTIAKTVIRYAPKYDIVVTFKNGSVERFSDIHRAAAHEQMAEEVNAENRRREKEAEVANRRRTEEADAEYQRRVAEAEADYISRVKQFRAELEGKTWPVRIIRRFFKLFRPERRKPVARVTTHKVEWKKITLADLPPPVITLAEMRRRIVELTTGGQPSNRGRQVKEVIIEHPAEALKGGTAIIDTPGTNAEAWHEDITKEVIREISDVSVVMTTADKPLPDTLNNFVLENLSDVLSQCIFVATKIDTLREAERDRQVAYIKQKASSTFGIPEPIVLPHAPMLVLGEADEAYRNENPYEKDDYQRLIVESHKTEQVIYKRLADQRVNIQAQRLSAVLGRTLSFLLAGMDARSKEYRERHAILEKHQKPDFVKTFKGLAEKHQTKFDNECKKVFESMWQEIGRIQGSQIQNLRNGLYGLPDKDSLMPYCKNNIPSAMNHYATELANCSHGYFQQTPGLATKTMKEFGTEFQKYYSELAVLDTKNIKMNYKVDAYQMGVTSFDGKIVKEALDNFEFKENLTTIAGAGTGALIGTFILPGIGSIIGGTIGGFVSALFGPSLDKLKHQVWDQIAPSIDQSYNNIYKHITDDLNKKYERLWGHLASQMNEYYNIYNELVASIIKRDKKEKERLESYIAKTEADKQEIERRQIAIGELGNYVGTGTRISEEQFEQKVNKVEEKWSRDIDVPKDSSTPQDRTMNPELMINREALTLYGVSFHDIATLDAVVEEIEVVWDIFNDIPLHMKKDYIEILRAWKLGIIDDEERGCYVRELMKEQNKRTNVGYVVTVVVVLLVAGLVAAWYFFYRTVYVTGVTLDRPELALNVGAQETLTADVQPKKAKNKNVSWASSDMTVATVDSGTVTGVAVGTATIQVTTQDGRKVATCDVSVSKPSQPSKRKRQSQTRPSMVVPSPTAE